LFAMNRPHVFMHTRTSRQTRGSGGKRDLSTAVDVKVMP
jgi:hypothetical protein